MLNDAWLSYAEEVIPANAPEVQRSELRRAFYAGARVLFDGVVNGVSEGEEPTLADLALMDAIKAELGQFLKDLKAGKA